MLYPNLIRQFAQLLLIDKTVTFQQRKRMWTFQLYGRGRNWQFGEKTGEKLSLTNGGRFYEAEEGEKEGVEVVEAAAEEGEEEEVEVVEAAEEEAMEEEAAEEE